MDKYFCKKVLNFVKESGKISVGTYQPKNGERNLMNHRQAETNFQLLHSQIVGDGTHDASIVLGRLLMILLFKSKLVGTTYLKEAVLYRYNKTEHTRISLTKEVYPTIADKFDTTVNRVERAIRNSIGDCYLHGNLFAFNVLTRSEVIDATYSPTNGELISNFASWLSLERQQNNIQ